MRRDAELIRQILIHMEENSDGRECEMITIEGVDEMHVIYHYRLLKDAGFMTAMIQDMSSNTTFCTPQSLTMSGHDLLDSIRSDTLWNKFKENLEKNGLPVVFGMLVSYAKQTIGLD